MFHTSKLIAVVSGLLASSLTASAAVVFSNLSRDTYGYGYQNPSSWIGGVVYLDAPGATITSATIHIRNVIVGYGNGTMELAFWALQSGADGILGTADDKIGEQLGLVNTGATTVSSNSPYTFSNFSIELPKNFVFTVNNVAGSLSYTIGASNSVEAIGGTTNPNTSWYGATGNPAEGLAVNMTGSTPVIQLNGVAAIPEPATAGVLLGLSGLGMALLRRRR